MLTIALCHLEPDPENVRRTPDAQGVEALAASIAAHGLLQNLVVRQKPRTKTRYLVTAGGRRLAALRQLVEAGTIPADHPVECQLIDGPATETSLAENHGQAPMAPVDAFEAFARLREGGLEVRDIARRFGLTERVVHQSLRLGDLAPELREALRAGHLSLDAARAFAKRTDRGVQLAAWTALGGAPGHEFQQSPWAIARRLEEGGVAADTRIARFVGLETYLDAGGGFERDLFAEGETGILTDPPLLERLAGERLAAEAERLADAGWGWIETSTELGYDTLAKLGRIYPEPADDPDLEAERAKLEARCDEIERAAEDGEPGDDEVAELDRIETRLHEIANQPGEYSVAEKALAGVIVAIGHDGTVRLEEGLVRPADRARLTALQAGGDVDDGADGAGDGPAPAGAKPWSNALLADLAAARGEVFQAHLAAEPDAAFDLLTFTIASQILRTRSETLGLALRAERTQLPGEGNTSPAAEAFLAAREALDLTWLGGGTTGTRFARFSALSLEARKAILAWSVAALAIPQISDNRAAEPLEIVGRRIGIVTRSLWTPSEATLFSRLSKAQILRVLGQCGGQAFADRHASMKKGDLLALAERFFAGDAAHLSPEAETRAAAWLPDGMGYGDPVLTPLPEEDPNGKRAGDVASTDVEASDNRGARPDADSNDICEPSGDPAGIAA